MKQAVFIGVGAALHLLVQPGAGSAEEKTRDGCKVVERKAGNSNSLSASVTAGGGKVSAHTTGGNSVTVHSGDGKTASSVATAGSSGSSTVVTGSGDCVIYVDSKEKSKVREK